MSDPDVNESRNTSRLPISPLSLFF